MKLNEHNRRLVELLYEALRQEYGLKILTPEPSILRVKLYHARRAMQDDTLSVLAVLLPAVPNQVWIVKAYAKDSGEGAASQTHDVAI